MDVHVSGQQRVEPARGLSQPVAPLLQRAGQPGAALPVVFGRLAAHGNVDHRVGQLHLQRRGGRIPDRPLQVREQPPIERPRVPVETDHVGIGTPEAHDVRVVIAGEPRQESVEPRERLIAIAGDRAPHARVALVEPGPAPLVGVTVPITHIDVEQPRREIGPGVHPVRRIPVELLPQLCRAHDLGHAGKDRVLLVGHFRRTFFELAQHAGEGRPELAQPRVIGQHIEARLHVEHARRREQGRDYQRAGGMAGADLILHDVLHERPAQLGRHRARRVLVHGTEHVRPAVRALEAERLRLAPTAALGGCEPSPDTRQIEHLDPHRRRPQIAVVPAEHDAVQPAGPVLRAGGHSHGARRGHSGRGGSLHRHDQQAAPAAF